MRRCLDLLTNLTPRTETLIHKAYGPQPVDCVLVEGESFTLANHSTVPVKTYRSEIGKLRAFVVNARLGPIEVFDPHDECAAGCSSRQPRNGRGSQVSEVEVAGWRRSEPTNHVPHSGR